MRNDLNADWWLGFTTGVSALYILQQTVGYVRAFVAYLKERRA